MIDRELRHAHTILLDEGREPFAAKSVLGIESASAFARHVPVIEWEPVETSAKIGDVNKLISTLGGSALYGDEAAAPLRELLQNAMDAVRAARALGYVAEKKGRVKVSVSCAEKGWWFLSVADSGVGMSRHVLVNVLLDFGNSLWGSDVVREELPGLAKSNFRAVGKFGIGFFSVFMLGNEVSIRTRRFAPDANNDLQWHLKFDEGLQSRPALLKPAAVEAMTSPGTIVSVKIAEARLRELLDAATPKTPFSDVFGQSANTNVLESGGELLVALVRRLCPASSVELSTQFDSQSAVTAVAPDDWVTISADALCGRTGASDHNLRPVISQNGGIIGRVAISRDAFHQGASITYQGIECGRAFGLAGIVEAKSNNLDARRVKATPTGTLAEWRKWAEGLACAPVSLPLEHRIRLHPLLPSWDLSVWIMGRREFTLQGILSHIADMDEILLHEGEVEREDHEDISEDRFGREFDPISTLICCPNLRPRQASSFGLPEYFGRDGSGAFPWFVGVSPIDYATVLRQHLHEVWPGYEEDAEELAIGDVDGLEIAREVAVFRRATSEEPPSSR